MNVLKKLASFVWHPELFRLPVWADYYLISMNNENSRPQSAESTAARRRKLQRDVIEALFNGGFEVWGIIEADGRVRIVRERVGGPV